MFPQGSFRVCTLEAVSLPCCQPSLPLCLGAAARCHWSAFCSDASTHCSAPMLPTAGCYGEEEGSAAAAADARSVSSGWGASMLVVGGGSNQPMELQGGGGVREGLPMSLEREHQQGWGLPGVSNQPIQGSCSCQGDRRVGWGGGCIYQNTSFSNIFILMCLPQSSFTYNTSIDPRNRLLCREI